MISQITRIAPSPTGLFHLGTARTAYINYLAAKASGGKFILRIDDTDVERNKEEYTKVIFDSLDWLGLEPDQIEYQSKRLELYSIAAQALLDTGKAFKADNGAVILKAPEKLPESFTDTIAGEIPITQTNRDQIDNKLVLLRGDDKQNSPIYQFASVYDDCVLMVNSIIRGVDHITNTPKQIAIWNAISADTVPLPQFTHLGLIFKDKKKLSKRDGAASLLWYKEQGYTSAAMLDWMLRLGWALKVPRGENSKEMNRLANEPISKERAIELFYNGTLKNSPCSYDLAKLDWLQKRHSA